MLGTTFPLPAPTCTLRRRVPDDSDISELIAAVTTGQEYAFAKVYDRFQPMVERVIVRCGIRSPEVQDVCQEVWIRALRFAGKVRDPVAFREWMRTVAASTARQHLRSLGRLQSHEAEVVRDGAPLQAEFRDPQAAALEREIDEQIRSALAALPPDLQRVAVKRFVDGERREDISRQLGLPSRTVKWRLTRALAVVRDIAGGSGNGNA
jgi:RNA polymerase sigma-70 factor, ECF subfamily